MRTLLVDGHIYSPAEAFASAVLVEHGTIAWIGSEGGAALHTTEVDEVVELDGDLIAPGFVHLAADHAALADGFVHAQRTGLAADRWPDAVWEEHADQPLAVVPADPCRLRSRIAAGAPTALLPAPTAGSGWEVIRTAMYGIDPDERLTARGAFAALTRGAWRLLGRPEDGVLRVGAQATFIRWRCQDLVVETPDTRISNWSTDPRSATPGLPLLEPGAPLPQFIAAWRGGVPQ